VPSGLVYTVHTNGVERLWGQIKRFIRSYNSPTLLDSQIDWAIYHRNFLKDLKLGQGFKKFLQDCTQHLCGPRNDTDEVSEAEPAVPCSDSSGIYDDLEEPEHLEELVDSDSDAE